MTNFYFKIKHKTNYKERTVCIVESNTTSARIELQRCYPNWNEVEVYKPSYSNFELATEKQLNYIAFIEEETGIQFNGQTKQEASQYIQENKEKVPASASINMWALVKGY